MRSPPKLRKLGRQNQTQLRHRSKLDAIGLSKGLSIGWTSFILNAPSGERSWKSIDISSSPGSSLGWQFRRVSLQNFAHVSATILCFQSLAAEYEVQLWFTRVGPIAFSASVRIQ